MKIKVEEENEGAEGKNEKREEKNEESRIKNGVKCLKIEVHLFTSVKTGMFLSQGYLLHCRKDQTFETTVSKSDRK